MRTLLVFAIFVTSVVLAVMSFKWYHEDVNKSTKYLVMAIAQMVIAVSALGVGIYLYMDNTCHHESRKYTPPTFSECEEMVAAKTIMLSEFYIPHLYYSENIPPLVRERLQRFVGPNTQIQEPLHSTSSTFDEIVAVILKDPEVPKSFKNLINVPGEIIDDDTENEDDSDQSIPGEELPNPVPINLPPAKAAILKRVMDTERRFAQLTKQRRLARKAQVEDDNRYNRDRLNLYRQHYRL